MKPLIASAILLLSASPFANANHHRGYIQAKVLNATPVYEYVSVSHVPQREVCQPSATSNQHNSTILGSVIGGSIGHATSDKRHKTLGTLAGAIIGGTIAHQISSSHTNLDYHNYKTQHCYKATQYQAVTKQRILKGYQVTYKIKGRTYQKFSQVKPQKHIRIYR